MLRQMFAPIVQEVGSGAFDVRPVERTLELAKLTLDAERERAGKPALPWEDWFGGAKARAGELWYEVRPIEIRI